VQLKLTSKRGRNNGDGNDVCGWQIRLKKLNFQAQGKSLPLTAAF
jgi:hypothetical protein